jgi:hypothetical protein
MYDSFQIYLCRKDPKKKSTGRKANMPRDTSPQNRRVTRDITAKRKNMVIKAATARILGTKVNNRTTRNRNNNILGNVNNCANFPLLFLPFSTNL